MVSGLRCFLLRDGADGVRDAGCNVGYAFVNFITVQDLLLFTKTQLGIKW